MSWNEGSSIELSCCFSTLFCSMLMRNGEKNFFSRGGTSFDFKGRWALEEIVWFAKGLFRLGFLRSASLRGDFRVIEGDPLLESELRLKRLKRLIV